MPLNTLTEPVSQLRVDDFIGGRASDVVRGGEVVHLARNPRLSGAAMIGPRQAAGCEPAQQRNPGFAIRVQGEWAAVL